MSLVSGIGAEWKGNNIAVDARRADLLFFPTLEGSDIRVIRQIMDGLVSRTDE